MNIFRTVADAWRREFKRNYLRIYRLDMPAQEEKFLGDISQLIGNASSSIYICETDFSRFLYTESMIETLAARREKINVRIIGSFLTAYKFEEHDLRVATTWGNPGCFMVADRKHVVQRYSKKAPYGQIRMNAPFLGSEFHDRFENIYKDTDEAQNAL